ncbi:MAG: DedA family protein [Planctomycetota bacterium]|nr:DedA family protein [Planctomycetota bacterium]MDP6763586.1 DedA family protein [Planctomycetota bacterium]MDP6988465.1 DedA family protein [Planctomycetota bacterium]
MLALVIDGLPEWADVLVGRSHYIGPFVLLFLCGVGLPLPEEVTLIGSGILLYREEVEFVPITLVCSAAILLGDSVPYWLGRRYGMSAVHVGWVARILHPERFALIDRRFQEHGNWVTFTCRFLPGIRIPGYFTAGTLGMPYWRFLALDLCGVAISVPTSIWLARVGAHEVQDLHQRMNETLHLILAFALVSGLLTLLVRQRMRLRARQAAQLSAAAAPGEESPPAGGAFGGRGR